jgi:hypothetical protein
MWPEKTLRSEQNREEVEAPLSATSGLTWGSVGSTWHCLAYRDVGSLCSSEVWGVVENMPLRNG